MLCPRQRRCRIEALEERTVLSADLVNGLLTVAGTNRHDNIQVQVAPSGPNAGQLEVNVNGALSHFDLSQVNSIQIFGLKGNDHIAVSDNVTINTSISGGKGNDTIKGGGGNDTIHGDAGNDAIDGSSGNDAIFGDKGHDSLQCGDGNDTASGDSGNDSVAGGAGNDLLYGDKGNDSLFGDDGDDRCYGRHGKDALRGGAGIDGLFGEDGNDAIWGDEDGDYLEGGNGNDDCRGGTGDDQMKGGRGNDRLDGEDGDDLADGDEGRDHIEDGIEAELENEFKALLTGSGGVAGEAEYELENEDGQLKTMFELEVEHLSANSTFEVIVNGIHVGQITTDASGQGKITLSSDPSGDDSPFPAGFPTIEAGMPIQVGNVLQGSFIKSYCL